MSRLPDGCVDMILCDLPYGTTACSWDSVIPFEPLWNQYRRLLSPIGAVVLTASQPFSAALVMSNARWFKYAWVWEKTRATGHVHVKSKPMKKHEDVLVFSPDTKVHACQSKTHMTYNPQGLMRKPVPTIRKAGGASHMVMRPRKSHHDTLQVFEGYPTSILKFASEGTTSHPTKKPRALFEYLIRIYTNPGDLVLDNCMGSGTTAVACINTGRKFVGFETDKDYFEAASRRIGGAR